MLVGAAEVRNRLSCTPLHTAMQCAQHFEVARHLLLGPEPELLPALLRRGNAALPLYPDLAASWPLPEAQWRWFPAPYASLAAALPAVLARPQAEARPLVQHLQPGQRQRRRTFALGLVRGQEGAGDAASRPNGAPAGQRL